MSSAPVAVLDDWDAVNAAHDAVVAAETVTAASTTTGISAGATHRGTAINFAVAVREVCTADMCAKFEPRLNFVDLRRASVWRRIKLAVAPPRLTPELDVHRTQIFAAALREFDYGALADERSLVSCWRLLTGDSLAPPRFGSHWERIGFQGTDPSTDLRGAGMLGLLQLLAFISHHQPLAVRIHALATDERQNFPLAVTSFQFTGVVLSVLRATRLHGYSRRCQSMWQAANDLHAALLYHFYVAWKRENATIAKFGDIKQRVEAEALASPKTVIERFKAAQTAQQAQPEGFLELH